MNLRYGVIFMKIDIVKVGELECNCYLLDKFGKVLVIDAGDDFNKIRECIGDREVVGVIITHYHFDHIGSLDDVKNKYNVSIYDIHNMNEGNNSIGEFNFDVIYTPGHKEDAITIYFKEDKCMFCGDFIFKDTIKENVVFGRDISDEKLEKAFRLAQAYDYVNEYPEKAEYMLDIKGANLSGGQKQRLTIARAIAGDPEILILDDASSALDYKTDAALRRAIKENYKDTTTVIVSQRVSSIMHADLILVLEEGKLIGAGSHEELLLSCGYYRDTAKSQMGGVILE
jgi:ABC-type phosphate transport system ATPase subunit